MHTQAEAAARPYNVATMVMLVLVWIEVCLFSFG
jgi:hypothetical protein